MRTLEKNPAKTSQFETGRFSFIGLVPKRDYGFSLCFEL